jgi:aarF domain-containing kinase
MNIRLSDLLAALPQDEPDSDVLASEEAQERLNAIFADLAHRPVPTGSLRRLWTLGELSTQVTLAYTALWFRRLFADAPAAERHTVDTNLRVALKMIHRLGYLRGAATKLGQALGNLPEILPDQVAMTLDSLHFQAPPMHFSLLREVVRNELGREPDDIFASFDKEPFAAASIGQVHRATLKSGEDVVVKIQYPGIARAVDADLRNFMALMFPMRLTPLWQSVKGQCEAIREMLPRELDYVQEAVNMREARALFAPEEGIVVPRVFDDYSSARVLTSEFIPGPHLPAFLKSNPTQSVRNAFGEKMAMAWYRMCFAFQSHADPHSGNYVFMDDGRLGLLDFGCVQHFSAEERAQFLRTDKFVEDPSVLPDLLLHGGFATERDLKNADYMRSIGDLWAWTVEPQRHEGDFDFGDESYFKRGIELTRDAALKRYTKAAPMYLYLSRSIFGSLALMLRLRTRFDIKRIHRREVEIRLRREARS